MTKQERIKCIYATVDDLVSYFLYYDRKEDEDLPVGEIEKAVEDGGITLNKIVLRFRRTLKERLST